MFQRLWAAWVAAVLTIVAGSADAEASRWGKDYIPNSSVVTQDGKTLRFYDDLVRGKVFVISFLFTTCRDICPLATSRLAELQEKLGDAMGRDVFFYSISIDPETDTPARLKQYADTFGAGPGWLFLTGTRADIDAIRFKLGERSVALADHRNEILLGNGTTGEWTRNNVLGDLAALAHTVRAMDPAWRDPAFKQGLPKPVSFDFASRPGAALFRRLCAGCHTIGKGDHVGPDLSGVTERRERDWLVSFMSDPPRMHRQKDPTVLALAARFPNVRMPPLGVTDDDAADLIAFIESQQPVARSLQPLAALTTHKGERFSLAELQGQPVAVVFGFTHCPDVCPTTLLDWSNELASLGPDGDRLKVLFVSVDTERDTPSALAAYLASFDPRIVALTGTDAQIAAAARNLGAFYEKVADKDGGFTFDHTVKTYLFGPDGTSSGVVDLNTPLEDRRKVLRRLVAGVPD